MTDCTCDGYCPRRAYQDDRDFASDAAGRALEAGYAAAIHADEAARGCWLNDLTEDQYDRYMAWQADPAAAPPSEAKSE